MFIDILMNKHKNSIDKRIMYFYLKMLEDIMEYIEGIMK